MDIFPSFRTKVEDLIAAKVFLATDVVLEEINAVGTPDLRDWAKKQPKMFSPMLPDLQVEAANIIAHYPDLADAKSTYESADPYVIAFAKISNGTVVSQETSVNEKRTPSKKYYIPDVCRDLGVPCINLLGLIRREKWIF